MAKSNHILPVYTDSKFQGIEIPSKYRGCIKHISKVKKSKEVILWPILWLPEEWKSQDLFQKNIIITMYYNEDTISEHTVKKDLISKLNLAKNIDLATIRG